MHFGHVHPYTSGGFRVRCTSVRYFLVCFVSLKQRLTNISYLQHHTFIHAYFVVVGAAGMTEIEDWHPYARFKYITHKFVTSFTNDDYLWIDKARREQFLRVTFTLMHDSDTSAKLRQDHPDRFYEGLEALFISDEDGTDDTTQSWNDCRKQVMHRAMKELLFPKLERDLHNQLLREARQFVTEQCANNLRQLINRAPFVNSNSDSPDTPGVRWWSPWDLKRLQTQRRRVFF